MCALGASKDGCEAPGCTVACVDIQANQDQAGGVHFEKPWLYRL